MKLHFWYILEEEKITMIKDICLWNFVGAVYYSVKNQWVHAPAAPVLMQALLTLKMNWYEQQTSYKQPTLKYFFFYLNSYHKI